MKPKQTGTSYLHIFVTPIHCLVLTLVLMNLRRLEVF